VQGRFVGRDPLAYDTDMNFYQYANSRPIDMGDSLGLQANGTSSSEVPELEGLPSDAIGNAEPLSLAEEGDSCCVSAAPYWGVYFASLGDCVYNTIGSPYAGTATVSGAIGATVITLSHFGITPPPSTPLVAGYVAVGGFLYDISSYHTAHLVCNQPACVEWGEWTCMHSTPGFWQNLCGVGSDVCVDWACQP